ncbi:MAG: hypothetical protein NUV76_12140 [Candidatus Kuenenia sp.]|nr:hypothetical protein [Candidatus Kuenenia sp.]
MKDYYHYKEIKNKKHREDHISEIIDKLSLIRVLIEDMKRYVLINKIKETEAETVARMLGNVESGIADLSDKIKLLF